MAGCTVQLLPIDLFLDQCSQGSFLEVRIEVESRVSFFKLYLNLNIVPRLSYYSLTPNTKTMATRMPRKESIFQITETANSNFLFFRYICGTLADWKLMAFITSHQLTSKMPMQ